MLFLERCGWFKAAGKGLAFLRVALASGLLALALSIVAPTGALASVDPRQDTGSWRRLDYVTWPGVREIRSRDVQMLVKWSDVLDRFAHEGGRTEAKCAAPASGRCIGGREWTNLLASLRDKDRLTQMREINRFVNQAAYRSDDENYGRVDYWATPTELFSRGGDCEDFALTKFFALRELGLDNRDIRLVVLQALDIGIPHAVLMVRVAGETYILDNRTGEIVTAESALRYRPIYSVNEEYWWLHLS